ncbi:MAG: hypothetical protein GWO10_16325 [candidate division Zixibacteria bacterium]|nr:hypothetical protein [Gammaproteobacteria bacterium]NIR25699.1 hypothetical protein [Gammaproteobacteria bacterium]NIR65292.1 hypothetical protein [candidate division Zixibacteria bacterium]NIS52336.1 hypothetical protein [Phycisphaerae bacterium]NIX02135.1 hypothetical protein [Phycisphaerae bacterium]
MTTTVGSHELEEWEVTYLLAIHEYMANQGKDVATPLPPSVRDMVHLTGATSTSVVNYWIKRLAANGYVVDNPAFHGISRASTRLTQLGKLVASVLYDTYALGD